MAMMVSVEEASAQLERLVDRVSAGEEVIIVRDGEPAARLVAARAERTWRAPGSAAGQLALRGDFDAPLPREILEGFGSA